MLTAIKSGCYSQGLVSCLVAPTTFYIPTFPGNSHLNQAIEAPEEVDDPSAALNEDGNHYGVPRFEGCPPY